VTKLKPEERPPKKGGGKRQYNDVLIGTKKRGGEGSGEKGIARRWAEIPAK